MAEGIQEVSDRLLGCVCTALEDADRPACACYATVGQPVIGPINCCECESGLSGELTIRMERLLEVDATSLLTVDRVRPCKRGAVAGTFVITLSRCYPRISETGELDTEAQDDASIEMNTDAAVVWTALACCTGVNLRIQEVFIDSPPQGGCSALQARVIAEVAPRPPAQES